MSSIISCNTLCNLPQGAGNAPNSPRRPLIFTMESHGIARACASEFAALTKGFERIRRNFDRNILDKKYAKPAAIELAGLRAIAEIFVYYAVHRPDARCNTTPVPHRSYEDPSRSAPAAGAKTHAARTAQTGAHRAGVQADVQTGARTDIRTLLRAYLELAKPEITLLVALSSVGGFFLAPTPAIDLGRLIWLLIGVTLASAGASALNHWLEREPDGAMRRTMQRPLPSGRLAPSAALYFGSALVAAGVGLLCPLVNPLTGALALATVLLYLFAYTPLKRRSRWNTLVGTLPGALPALGGWTAATGSVGWGGAAAFCILAAWQMPHFLALAWMYRKDYERGGYAMLSVADPTGRSVTGQTLFFTLALCALSLWPVALSLAGWIYAAAAVALGGWFLHAAIAFRRSRDVRDARRVLRVSIWYIPALVLALLIDRMAQNGLF